MSLRAITRQPGRRLSECEVTHIERTAVDVERARRQHAAYEAALREAGAVVESLPPDDWATLWYIAARGSTSTRTPARRARRQ